MHVKSIITDTDLVVKVSEVILQWDFYSIISLTFTTILTFNFVVKDISCKPLTIIESDIFIDFFLVTICFEMA